MVLLLVVGDSSLALAIKRALRREEHITIPVGCRRQPPAGVSQALKNEHIFKGRASSPLSTAVVGHVCNRKYRDGILLIVACTLL